MLKYDFEIQLKYFSSSLLNKHDLSGDIEILFNHSVFDESYTGVGDSETQEPCIVSISENYLLSIKSIYAHKDECAVSKAYDIVDKYSKVLSYVVQSQNSNVYQFHIKFIYDRKDLKFSKRNHKVSPKFNEFEEKEDPKGSNQVKLIDAFDTLNMRDSLHIGISQTFQIEEVKKLSDDIGDNKDLWFLMECYYHALGLSDYKSKYFNLFIIIEFIEKNVFHKTVEDKVYQKDQVENIMSNIKLTLEGNTNNKQQLVQIQSRLKQVIESITTKGRSDKLYHILQDTLKISKTKILMQEIEVDKELVTKLIKMRNGLFHAKVLTPREKEDIVFLSNVLLLLCENIIRALIENKSLFRKL